MSDSNPLSGDVWRRGAQLGLQLFGVFALVAGLVYAGMGLLGWAGTTRALVAMLVGPLMGSVVIALWWLARRPMLMPDPETSDE